MLTHYFKPREVGHDFPYSAISNTKPTYSERAELYKILKFSKFTKRCMDCQTHLSDVYVFLTKFWSFWMPVSFTIGPISTKGFVNLALIPLSGYIYIYIYIYIYMWALCCSSHNWWTHTQNPSAWNQAIKVIKQTTWEHFIFVSNKTLAPPIIWFLVTSIVLYWSTKNITGRREKQNRKKGKANLTL